MDEQNKVNTDSIRNLVDEGVIENVQGEEVSTDELERPVE